MIKDTDLRVLPLKPSGSSSGGGGTNSTRQHSFVGCGPPLLLPCAVEDGRFSSAFRDDAQGLGFGRGGLYSPQCWRPATDAKAPLAVCHGGSSGGGDGPWYELDLGGSRLWEVHGVVTKGRAGFGTFLSLPTTDHNIHLRGIYGRRGIRDHLMRNARCRPASSGGVSVVWQL